MIVLFSILFANLLNSIIKRKRFKFDPTTEINLDEKGYDKLRKDLRKYIKSTNFKRLIKLMQKDIDKYFGQVILVDTENQVNNIEKD